MQVPGAGGIPGVGGGLPSVGSVTKDPVGTINSIKNAVTSLNNNNPLHQIGTAKNSINNAKSFLNSLNNPNKILSLAETILVPIAKQLINQYANIDTLILIAQKILLDRLKSTGSAYISGNTIYYTPLSNDQSYKTWIGNYNNIISTIRNILSQIENVLNTLQTTLTSINVAISVMSILITVQNTAKTIQQAIIALDQSSPSPVKPTTGPSIVAIAIIDGTVQATQQLIDKYQPLLLAGQGMLTVYQALLQQYLSKFNNLNVIINTSSTTQNPNSQGSINNQEVININNTAGNNSDSGNNGTNSGNSGNSGNNTGNTQTVGNQYILTLITNKDGSRYVTITDKFSGLLLSQTAPSFYESDNDLFSEARAILSSI